MCYYSIISISGETLTQIVKYLLENSEDNNRTWSIHMKHLSITYNMEDPLTWLKRDPPEKSRYKEQAGTELCQAKGKL